MILLQVENLYKVYSLKDRQVEALKGVSFTARDGEILGIVGKSGSGKSTLMKILRGVESFDSGRIEIDGLVITPESDQETVKAQRQITAIHLQRDFGLWTESALNNVVKRVYSRKTGYEMIPTEYDLGYEEVISEAMEYLKVVGLEKKAKQLATILSGGEKQRLLIARQLAKKPKVLLLDEPATMACPSTKQEVLDAIKNVNRELGITTLVVSHLPEVHRYLADRLIWLDQGEIRDEGDTDAVLDRFLSLIGEADPLAPRRDAPPAIRVVDLRKRNYLVGTGEVLRIEDLDLDIREGEITSLIGASGSGKTTLLKIVQGIAKPDEGSVFYRLGDGWVDMVEYSRERMEVRRNLGIMYQEFALMPRETVLEQIGYKMGVKGQDVIDHARKVAEELGISDKVLDVIYSLTDMTEDDAKGVLEKLGLTTGIFEELFPRFPATEARRYAEPIFEVMDLDTSVLDKYPSELSGGEKVRVSLALVLASNPKILILDEPFGDIDPITLREVSNAIKRINAEFGTTILLVSHHVDFVREISHRAVLIDAGSVLADGDTKEVCDLFISRCDAAYLQEVPRKTAPAEKA
ncbi:ATP-binding cassette domain-containing protein [Methanotrichaceae archaeon M04Ac]|uniref:ATP-binding cassette domain-containing protein n=1 Tax=Candidatus Methanocrinis alkalitolerans TaxID=3033395 RepID=A0ABT5XBR7_9EURY|nr:ATP-binding cassette domain-containing protein [Candidatus Methanocrinis alkalitolerans]MDF0592156.1 ATP-binding cassette domain-containing protein [Candidatus Methanocrinis alkalitolerans]